ncbi:MAG: 2-C-methyl-D-erythritol 2,4-cyclodiphosphate synthase [Eubacteriales bacterium]
MRIGHGYDVHRFTEGKSLVLGGVEVPFEYGLLAHSDGDVITHAVCDALLGGAGLGDIGFFFPDSDAKYKDISSLNLIDAVADMLCEKNLFVEYLDITVVAEKPKLAPYIPKIREKISKALKIPACRVNVKATTEEGLGLAGGGIGCHAVCLLKEWS